MRLRVAGVIYVALALTPALPGPAHADDNDLVLSRFGTPIMNGPNIEDVIPDNQRFRSFASELGVVLAPTLSSPTDTLGYSGFQFSVDLAMTSISNTAAHWCATEESTSCDPGFDKSNYPQTIGLFARKGMWMPVPSFEVGAGAVHLVGSKMWAGQVYGKLAVHEGYHDWPIPSVAVRGAASRLFGSEQLDLTIASIDVSIGKSFGVQGTVNLSPYLGWNYLWIVPRSEVIDATPDQSAFDPTMGTTGDIRANFVFPDQDNITRTRIFGGLKIKYYVFALTFEVNFAFAGDSVDDVEGTDTDCDSVPLTQRNNCDAVDQAGSQQTYSLSISMDI
jgi:hypothetical protein